VKQSRKIKVLRIITRLNIGGPALHAILLTSGLDKEKFESHLLTGQEGESEGNMLALMKEEAVKPVVIKTLERKISWRNDLRTLWEIWKIVRWIKPDILHTHLAKAGTLGRVVGWLANVPVIIHTFHGHTFHSYFSPLKTKLFILIEKWLSLFTTRIITLSSSQRQEILNYGIGNPKKVIIIPLGLDLEEMLKGKQNEGMLRKELKVGVEIPLVGIIARLVPIKGHHYFLEAARIVATEIPSVKFLIIGDGPLRESLKTRAERLGLENYAIFLGFRRDLAKIYADLDLVVLSSLNEGLPVSIIEAMAARKAVVATNVGGVKDLIRPGVNGLLVPPKRPDLLAEAIISLLKDPSKRKKMGEIAQKKFAPQFKKENLFKNLSSLYHSLLAEKNVELEKLS
jgi:glycosyltransferase involved in cell wall biosynthesis